MSILGGLGAVLGATRTGDARPTAAGAAPEPAAFAAALTAALAPAEGAPGANAAAAVGAGPATPEGEAADVADAVDGAPTAPVVVTADAAATPAAAPATAAATASLLAPASDGRRAPHAERMPAGPEHPTRAEIRAAGAAAAPAAPEVEAAGGAASEERDEREERAEDETTPAPADTITRAAPDPTATPTRDVAALAPEFRERLERVLDRMRDEFGHKAEVVETRRSQSRQDALYAQGRTRSGPVVTWTRNSAHLGGYAADVVVDSSYSTAAGYARLASIAAEEGLRTLGPRDPGHVELPGATDRPGYAGGGLGGEASGWSARGMAPIVATHGAAPKDPTVFSQSPYAAAMSAAPSFLAGAAEVVEAYVSPSVPAPVARVAAVAPVAPVAAMAVVAPVAVPGAVVAGAPAPMVMPSSVGTPGAKLSPSSARPDATHARSEERGTARAPRAAALPATLATPVIPVAATAVAEPAAPGERRGPAGERRRGPNADDAAVDARARGQQAAPVAAPTAESAAPASPVAAPNAAERVARLLDVRDASPARPLSHIVLQLDNGRGGQDQVRVELRGTTVDAAIGVTDAAQLERLSASVGELQRALEDRGLRPDALSVTSRGAAAEPAPAAAALAALDPARRTGDTAGGQPHQGQQSGSQQQDHSRARPGSDPDERTPQDNPRRQRGDGRQRPHRDTPENTR